MNTFVKEKLLGLLDYLNHGLVERDGTLKAALLTMLAGENLLLVGPPGTAKSLIARKVAECLAHDGGAEHAGEYFEYLLTKFSTPDEIFGPLSISELKADRFKRNTAGYLPSVRIAFLDEIFKASSSILNALLTILNERVYHNGTEAKKVPLQALIAASNELPAGQEELDALYDRFLVRSFVDYVSEDNLPRLLDKPGPAPRIAPLSSADLTAIRQAAEAVTLPADIVSVIQKIWADHKQLLKDDRRENLSDRRLRKVVGLLCISAATNGRETVNFSDLLLLKDCLWNHPDNAHKVKELVLKSIRSQLSSLEKPASHSSRLVEVVWPSSYMNSNGVLGVWHKNEGDVVARDTALAEIETDMVVFEIGAPMGGTLVKAIKSRGDTVTPGEVIAYLDPEITNNPVSAQPQKETAKMGAVVKGYKGRGSRHDPILIENLHDLVGLERPEIGLQGYCFRQTSDINCSELTTWLNITFQGTYDGGGYSINDKRKQRVELFASVQPKSELKSLCLNGLGLANKAYNSKIFGCVSDVHLLTNASSCDISYCQSGDSLILDSVKNSTINHCRSKHVLITHVAGGCTIQDCEIQITGKLNSDLQLFITSGRVQGRCVGGIAASIENGTIVERCFVTGSGSTVKDRRIAFSGMAGRGTSSTIRACAFGQFKPKGIVCKRISPIGEAALTLENNVALDCHEGESDPNGPDGKSLSAALFTQHYFEHTLNWDFKNVWQWNDAESHPKLRTVSMDVINNLHFHDVPSGMGDLLTQQLTANLWL